MGKAMNGKVTLVVQLAAALLVASCENGGDVMPVTPLQLSQSCDVQVGCVAASGDFSLRFSMGPGIQVLAPFPVSVEVQGAQSVDSVTVTFAMRGMDMGVNRYQLISDGADRWLANVTLPVCSSGRSDWFAVVEVITQERRFAVDVPFAIEK